MKFKKLIIAAITDALLLNISLLFKSKIIFLNYFLIHTRFNTFKSLCEIYLIASLWRWIRDVYFTFIFFLLLCTRKFFIQKLYEREIFFFFNNFVVWNWFSKSIINIIHIAIVVVLRSLNNRFIFVIFALYNIFLLFFLQFEQKSSTYLTIMCFSLHRQCVVKTSKTRHLYKNLLN